MSKWIYDWGSNGIDEWLIGSMRKWINEKMSMNEEGR